MKTIKKQILKKLKRKKVITIIHRSYKCFFCVTCIHFKDFCNFMYYFIPRRSGWWVATLLLKVVWRCGIAIPGAPSATTAFGTTTLPPSAGCLDTALGSSTIEWLAQGQVEYGWMRLVFFLSLRTDNVRGKFNSGCACLQCIQWILVALQQKVQLLKAE